MKTSLDRSRLVYIDNATYQLLRNEPSSFHRYVLAPLNIRGIVCIGCWGRSGSGLMSSMVDNHPELVQIYPQHSLIAANTEVLSEIGKAASIADAVNAIVACFAHVNGHPAEWRWTSLAEDRAGIFSEVLAHLLQAMSKDGHLTRRNAFLAIHAAYAQAMDCLPRTDTPFVVWQSHANDFAVRREIRGYFPEARFLVMGRYPPRARDSALVAFSEVLPQSLPEAYGHFFHSDPFHVSMQNLVFMREMGRQMYPGEDIVAVRFEDLHMRTRETMEWLGRWIGVAWHDSFLESTVRGVFGWGKASMYGSRFNIGTRTLSWEDYCTKAQSFIDLVKYRAYQDEFMEAWGYKAIPMPRIARFVALKILCYWPVRLQWRVLRKLLWRPAHLSRTKIIAEFFKRHRELAKEFRAGYACACKGNCEFPVVEKASVNDIKWPGPEIRTRLPSPA